MFRISCAFFQLIATNPLQVDQRQQKVVLDSSGCNPIVLLGPMTVKGWRGRTGGTADVLKKKTFIVSSILLHLLKISEKFYIRENTSGNLRKN